MADTSVSSEPGARKRTIDELEASEPLRIKPEPDNENNELASPITPALSIDGQNNALMSSAMQDRDVSPAPSTLTSISVNTLSAPPQVPGSTGLQPPKKRRKLTAQEKLELEQLKKEKALKREEEKLAKAEEMRKKNEEREEKKRQREIEKQEKEQAAAEKKQQKEAVQKQREEAKKQKEEAAAKKERNQLRLTSFFPGSPAKQKSSPEEATRGRSMSIGTLGSAPVSPIKAQAPLEAAAPKTQYSYYTKTFLPFNLQANAALPPKDSTVKNEIRLEDTDLVTQNTEPVLPPLEDNTPKTRSKRSLKLKSLRTLLAELDKEVRKHTIKYLHFEEDVRPPYCGTWTKEVSEEKAKSVARNSSKRTLEDINYDYDSEAEWQEPEEGEDVNSDGEDDAEIEDAGDDMDGFLDNVDDLPNKSLIPKEEVKWTPMLFENEAGDGVSIAAAAFGHDLVSHQMGLLIAEDMDPGSCNGIKPYTKSYWGGVDNSVSMPAHALSSRVPLTEKFDSLGNRLKARDQTLKPSKPKPQPKTAKQVAEHMISGPDLELLKNTIVNRSEKKMELIAYIQKNFPQWKYSKQTIGHTISTVATRHPQLKTWLLIQMPSEVLKEIQPPAKIDFDAKDRK